MKDPAFLFYPGDYICETMGMSRIERDCFMDLILLQFNHYHFTAHQAENVLKEDFAGVWLNIKERFIQEGEYYFNVSIRTAIAKRKAYVKSRQEIAMSGKKKKKAQPGENPELPLPDTGDIRTRKEPRKRRTYTCAEAKASFAGADHEWNYRDMGSELGSCEEGIQTGDMGWLLFG